jgi:hypothetical protein
MNTDEQHEAILKELRTIRASQAYLEEMVSGIAIQTLKESTWNSTLKNAAKERAKVLSQKLPK